jgi:predicted flavoprotein YhiN
VAKNSLKVPLADLQLLILLIGFRKEKVKLKTEPDGRMFPVSDDSQTIIDCLEKEAKKLKIDIRLESEVKK